MCAIHLVVPDSLWPHRLQPTRLLCPWDSPGKNTGVGCHALLQGIFLTRDRIRVSCVSCGVFITSATWEAPDSVEEGLMERKISRDCLRLIKACV